MSLNEIFDFVVKYSPLLMSGVKYTLALSLVSGILCLIVGAILCYFRMSRVTILRWFANAWIEFVHGTPVLAQMMMVFYGLPLLGVNFPKIMFWGFDWSRMLAGIIALVFNSSAYIAEIIRSGIQSVDVGQMEAARAVGFGKIRSMRYVVMPQSIKNILPNFANEFANLIKYSSQAMVIGIPELMFTSGTISGISYEPFLPVVMVTVMYFLMTFAVSLVVRALEKHYKKSDKQAENSSVRKSKTAFLFNKTSRS